MNYIDEQPEELLPRLISLQRALVAAKEAVNAAYLLVQEITQICGGDPISVAKEVGGDCIVARLDLQTYLGTAEELDASIDDCAHSIRKFLPVLHEAVRKGSDDYNDALYEYESELDDDDPEWGVERRG